MERDSQSTAEKMQLAEVRDGGDWQVRALALESAVRRVSEVVRGKEEVVRLAMICFLARGHLLLEDVPGVGKTTLGRALAKILGGSFARIQLTADLLPADIVGGQVLDKKDGSLRFRAGPVFANVVLADELNRATPRTQSGLLEAMSERSISVDGETHALPDPFLVIATQNPVEHHGVYVLPQSQMDRFLVRTNLGYPDDETECALLLGSGSEARSTRVEDLEPVFTPAVTRALLEAVDEVTLSVEVARYIQKIVRATREAGALATGVSTRGALSFAQAARARAMVLGRRFVTPDDVHALALPVCAHRVVVRGNDRPAREEVEALLEGIVEQVPAPV